MWAGNTAYGPNRLPAGNFVVPYTPIANQIAGIGTIESPWLITTTVGLGSTGLQLTTVTTYVNGTTQIHLTTTIRNTRDQAQAATLFHAGDLYLEFPNNTPDYGYGTYRAATGGVGATTSSGDWAFLFEPVQPGRANAYQEASYRQIWNAIGNDGTRGIGFDNTFRTDYHDAGAGLQWNLDLPANGSVVVQHRLRLEDVDLRAYSPDRDGFHFGNFSTITSLSRRDFVETFRVGTCPTDNGECTLDQPAEQWYQTYFASVGSAGHCYGMTVLSAMFYRQIYAPSTYRQGANQAYDLPLENTLRRQIAIFHTYQTSYPIWNQLERSRLDNSPLDIYNAIETEINNHNLNPLILGMTGSYFQPSGPTWNILKPGTIIQTGHAVLAYRTQSVDATTKRVYVYDPRFPGDANRYLEFNLLTNTWKYDMGLGFLSAVGGLNTWGGNDSDRRNLSMIPMSAHTGQVPALPYQQAPGVTWIETHNDLRTSTAIFAQRGVGQVGINYQSGEQINTIPGAIIAVPFSTLGLPESPSFYLPSADYRIELGSNAIAPHQAALDIATSNLYLQLDALGLQPTSTDRIQASSTGTQFSYQSNDPTKEIELRYSYEDVQQAQTSWAIEASGVEVGQNNSLRAGIDRTSDRFWLQSPDSSAKTYDIRLRYTQAGQSGSFQHFNLVLPAGATQYLRFADTPTSRVIVLDIDRDSNGSIDESVQLANTLRIALPLIATK